MLVGEDWILDIPSRVSEVMLRWQDEVPPTRKLASEKRLSRLLPLDNGNQRLSSMSRAISSLENPSVFENRTCYRLLAVDNDAQGVPELTFTKGRYFDFVDTGELLALESAKQDIKGKSLEADLRKKITDPFDLTTRPVIASINTLTLVRGQNGVSFFLHDRDPNKVPVAGKSTHVIPAGGFQPAASNNLRSLERDFDLWRNVMREYHEEFLGADEVREGHSTILDYDSEEPYTSLQDAVKEGGISPWYLGVGLDPLTLVAEILTVVVFQEYAFEIIFEEMVEGNEEGKIMGKYKSQGKIVGFDFSDPQIKDLLGSEGTHVAAKSCLQLAWKHRDLILEGQR